MVSTPFVAVPPPGYGGTELVVHALGQALTGLGHHVTLFATGDSRARNVRALFATAVWPPDPYSELLHARFAARAIQAGRYDVVHAHVPSFLAFADELATPVVYTVHHAEDDVLARFYGHLPRVRRVSISRRQAAITTPRPHAVVHHGLDQAMYPECGAGGDRAFFLGRLSWCKAPELAIEAARRAGLPIVVAGRRHEDGAPRGWERSVLEPALRAPHVRWVQGADLGAKRRAFASARALLVPLRWEEPFGLVMIEAALAGCPVIAFARGAAPEIVEHGGTGFLVRDVDEMAEALRLASRLDRRAIQARARVRFSAARMALEYLGVYRAAIDALGRRAAPALEAEGDGGWTTLAR